MNKIFNIMAALFLLGTLASCAIHSGAINSTAAQLNQANFNYVQTNISGSAKTTKFLGIGGLGKSAIVGEAKKNMMETNFPLGPNQALVNVSVDWKMGFFFILVTNKCTVTADVVEFK